MTGHFTSYENRTDHKLTTLAVLATCASPFASESFGCGTIFRAHRPAAGALDAGGSFALPAGLPQPSWRMRLRISRVRHGAPFHVRLVDHLHFATAIAFDAQGTMPGTR